MAPINPHERDWATKARELSERSPSSATMKGGVNPFMGFSNTCSDTHIDTTPVVVPLTRQLIACNHAPGKQAALKRRHDDEATTMEPRKRREPVGYPQENGEPCRQPSNQSSGVECHSAVLRPAHPGQHGLGSPSSTAGTSKGINSSPHSQLSSFSPNVRTGQPAVRLPASAYLRPDHVLRSPKDVEIMALLDAAPTFKSKGVKTPTSRKPGDFNGAIQAMMAIREAKIEQGPGGNVGQGQQSGHRLAQQQTQNQHEQLIAHAASELPQNVGRAVMADGQILTPPSSSTRSTAKRIFLQTAQQSSRASQIADCYDQPTVPHFEDSNMRR